MKQDTHDQEKQRAIHERNRQHTHNDMQARQNQDFYARMGLPGPETETSVPADIFVVSIHCECWTHEEREASEAGTRKIELDHVTADAHDLVLHGREYGLSEPSGTDPRMSSDIWFAPLIHAKIVVILSKVYKSITACTSMT